MKKIFAVFLLCFTALSGNAFADDSWGKKVNVNAILNVIKTTSVAQYMVPDKFINYIENHWEPTFQDLLDACKVSVSQDTRKNCETFFIEVVKEHNRLIDENSATTTQTGQPVQSSETPSDGSVIKIKIDLDGGTPVSGNCANEIVIKSGTPVTLDCDAVKNGKHLSGYVDNYGTKKTKNCKIGFDGNLSQAEIDGGAVSTSLKAIYDGADASKVSTNDDGFATEELRQQRKDNQKEKIRHLRRNQNSEFTNEELKLYHQASGVAGSVARGYVALAQYVDSTGKIKTGDRTALKMYDCDVKNNMCGFTFDGEKSGVRFLVCCNNIRNNSATCSVPYTWQKGDTEHTSVSDCR